MTSCIAISIGFMVASKTKEFRSVPSPTIWMNQNSVGQVNHPEMPLGVNGNEHVLGKPLNTVIKLLYHQYPLWCLDANVLTHLLVRIRGTVEPDLVRNDEAGLGTSANDEVSKIAVVRLNVTLPRSQRKSFLEQRSEWKSCTRSCLKV